MRDDRRLDEAKAIPILTIAEKLDLKLAKVSPVEHAGPCPDCGGNDRFAINTQKNVFGCRKCGAGGDGLALVQLAKGCDFAAALTYLAGEADLALDPAEIERRRKKREAEETRRKAYADRERARAISAARQIWASAEGCDLGPAIDYLAGRGIRFDRWPPSLRCLPAHPYRRKLGGSWHEFHRGPALIAGVQGPDNRLRAVHQTWLDPAGPKGKARILDLEGKSLPSKLVRGSKKGGAIRLTPMPPEGGVLVMGEGIETTASAMVVRPIEGAAWWAGVDLGNMSGRQVGRNSGQPDLADPDAFLPPPWISRLVFLQDGDSEPKATRAKLESGLRRAQHASGGRLQRAEIVAAPEGMDFNDVLQQEAPPDEDE
ncbi:DUF7146 domain-containing protein [Salipiger thiooxidans]|uniref:DUF7146 domain-containing protein n=1 Tax=Salipiger thiooxidans TaxID=282683 RepID=UPI001CD55294|nr:CHC2 zinc finger domain-containing protein [Salipiger thiooxidans]MCA0851221.1 hypothetical protein [Salipiger thiooxidans]